VIFELFPLKNHAKAAFLHTTAYTDTQNQLFCSKKRKKQALPNRKVRAEINYSDPS